MENNPSAVLQRAMNVKDGVVMDERINKFQNR